MADLLYDNAEGEARLLILIDAFTTSTRNLEGRTKLAKLDFLLRYPRYFRRAMEIRVPGIEIPSAPDETNIENRMVRFRYGPWDPSYFVLIGRLVGKGLVIPVSQGRGVGYRSTDIGRQLARDFANDETWAESVDRAKLLRKHLDLTGTNLMKFVYENFPEVVQKKMGESI